MYGENERFGDFSACALDCDSGCACRSIPEDSNFARIDVSLLSISSLLMERLV